MTMPLIWSPLMPASAQVINIKLSNIQPLGHDVLQFRISADDSRVVYTAEQDTDNVLELYSVPSGGGTTTKLNNTLPSGGDVGSFRISTDSSRVVYRADQDTDGVQELYSVPIGGGTATKLNGTLVSGGEVRYEFQISADSSRVVYLADQDTYYEPELYSVPISGGTPTKLNGTIPSGGEAYKFQISADSSRVVYTAHQDTVEAWELYSVSISGGTSTRLNGTMISGGNIIDFQISTDNSKAVYTADQDRNEIYELYASWILEPEPEIDVQRPAGMPVAEGSIDNVGNRPVGTIPLTYTISNTGTAELIVPAGGVTATNLVNSGWFSVGTSLPLTIAAGTSTTLPISFDVTEVGVFSLDVDIANNDADENPYTFVISGAAIVNTPTVAASNDYAANDGTPLSGNVITDDTGDGVDYDPDGDPFIAVLDNGTNNGTVELHIDGSFIYTSVVGFDGTDSFSYHGDDGDPGNTVVVWITVNNRPKFSPILDQSITKNETLSLAITIYDSSTDLDNLTLSAESSNSALVPSSSIIFSGSGRDRTVTITPTAGMTGTTTITLDVDDRKGSSSEAFVLTVNDQVIWRVYMPTLFNSYGVLCLT